MSPPSPNTDQSSGAVSKSAEIARGYDTDSAAVVLGAVVVGGNADPTALVKIALAMFNRHGLVAGATGTGKTKTLQLIAEQLSTAGVPVLIPDIKGDLSGMSIPGRPGDRITQRAADTGDPWQPSAFPVEYLTLAGQGNGVPIRATVDSFGPILLSKVLALNDTQESTLGLIFHFADQRHLPLLDIKDLRAVIGHLTGPQGKADLQELGGVSSATAGVILRAVTNLEAQGGDLFFGEPQMDVADLLRTAPDGRGIVSLLEATDLQARPELFSTFLMWLLAELFEVLPEVGDLDKPKLVFLFDEAHLLFTDASKAFRAAVQQTVKLIRSKGVGVFFCSQLPTDLPGPVLSQLGGRIQHALRAFTPDDQKALSATVRTYPTSKVYDLQSALTSLATGEAIVTVLSESGAPTPVAWTRMRAPRSLMGPAGPEAVAAAVAGSPLSAKYGQSIDRESAYELLTGRLAAPSATPSSSSNPQEPSDRYDGLPPVSGEFPSPLSPPSGDGPWLTGTPSSPEPSAESASGGFLGDMMASPVVASFMRSLGTSLGGALGRSVFGTRTRRRR
jgi:DNA helicase HerA-like ATPase